VLLASDAHAQRGVAPTGSKAVDDAAFNVAAPGTSATADALYVLSAGNSSANSLGLRADLKHRWGRHSVQLQAGALRAESSTGQRTAHGTPESFEIHLPAAEPTAETYDARGRYDYKIGQRLFHTLSAGWERNRFAGIANRWVLDTGVGNVFAATEQTSLRAALTVTYTEQGTTVFGTRESSFVGSRLGWDLSRKLWGVVTRCAVRRQGYVPRCPAGNVAFGRGNPEACDSRAATLQSGCSALAPAEV
jgi:hypothetical protein